MLVMNTSWDTTASGIVAAWGSACVVQVTVSIPQDLRDIYD